jgi:hypothetical protein
LKLAPFVRAPPCCPFSYALPDEKAKCVINWYYKGTGPEQLIGALRQLRELPVTGVLQVLAKRLC